MSRLEGAVAIAERKGDAVKEKVGIAVVIEVGNSDGTDIEVINAPSGAESTVAVPQKNVGTVGARDDQIEFAIIVNITHCDALGVRLGLSGGARRKVSL